MQEQETGYRELLMSSALVTQPDASIFDQSCVYEVTVEISESGWADLSRLQILAAHRVEQPQPGLLDVLPLTTVESIRVHNTRELIRGQGQTVGAPAGAFSPFRQYLPIQLGRWRLEGGNTVTVRLRTDVLMSEAEEKGFFAYSVAFPFAPDNKREFRLPSDLDLQTATYVASRRVCYGKAQHTALLEVRFDQDGVVDLDSLQILVDSQPPTREARGAVSTTAIESIELSTRQELILGGNSAEAPPRAAPAAIFASLGRRFHWLRFGYLEVSTNNSLLVRLADLEKSFQQSSEQSTTLSMGLQFYPNKSKRYGA